MTPDLFHFKPDNMLSRQGSIMRINHKAGLLVKAELEYNPLS